jgi:nucleoside-diphosphate-sugar epimerase
MTVSLTKNANILVTGSNSGLGKHCLETFNGFSFARQTVFADILKQAQQEPFAAIIHSAFNTKAEVDTTQLYTYLSDTSLLTRKLLSVPHQKFIFISSADVYPKNNHPHREEEIINLSQLHNIYSASKLISENIVQNETENFLILRPTALLGKYAKPNSLIKILRHDTPTLTLAADSSFNYICHAHVTDFITHALQHDLKGIYNIAASSTVKLSQIAQRYNRPVNFGKYSYQTGHIVNDKAAGILNQFKNTSLENIELFLNE